MKWSEMQFQSNTIVYLKEHVTIRWLNKETRIENFIGNWAIILNQNIAEKVDFPIEVKSFQDAEYSK